MIKFNMWSGVKKQFLDLSSILIAQKNRQNKRRTEVYQKFVKKVKIIYNNIKKNEKVPTFQRIKDNPIRAACVGVFIGSTLVAFWNPENLNTASYKPRWWKASLVDSKPQKITKNYVTTTKKHYGANGNTQTHREHNDVTNKEQLGKTKLRILLLGATGSGKSSVGNVLLNKEVFKTSYYATPETKKSVMKSLYTNLYEVDVIDTPAIKASGEHTDEEIKEAVRLSGQGPHAIILCIPATSITKYYTDCFEPFEKYFFDRPEHFLIVAFTRYDQFEMECSHTENPKDEFDRKLVHVIEQNSTLKKVQNIKEKQIFLSNNINTEHTAALKQVVNIIDKIKKEIDTSNGTVFARSKVFKETNN